MLLILVSSTYVSLLKCHIFIKRCSGLRENYLTTDQSEVEARMKNICINGIFLDNHKPLQKK